MGLLANLIPVLNDFAVKLGLPPGVELLDQKVQEVEVDRVQDFAENLVRHERVQSVGADQLLRCHCGTNLGFCIRILKCVLGLPVDRKIVCSVPFTTYG